MTVEYFNNARDMVKQTQEICEAYDLVPRSRKGKSGDGWEVYTVDGEWQMLDGVLVKLQFQFLIYDICKWRWMMFVWNEDERCWVGGGMRKNDDYVGDMYFDTFQEAVEDAWQEAPVMALISLDEIAEENAYADEADDVDD